MIRRSSIRSLKETRQAGRGGDRTSKLAVAELHERATRRIAADFLHRLIEVVPDKVHTVLTDNGTHFTEPSGDGWRSADIRRVLDAGETCRCHAFELACAQNGVEHRLTKPNHPRRDLLTASPPEIGSMAP